MPWNPINPIGYPIEYIDDERDNAYISLLEVVLDHYKANNPWNYIFKELGYDEDNKPCLVKNVRYGKCNILALKFDPIWHEYKYTIEDINTREIFEDVYGHCLDIF